MRDEIITELKSLQDAKYRKFHLRTCPQAENLLGVRMPAQRKLAKKIVKADFREFLQDTRGEFYEEIIIEGIVIATAKMPIGERLEFLKNFVPKINNWAICDCVCASMKFTAEELPQVWDFILQYQKSEKEYELRFMVVMMMDHFRDKEHLPRILEIVEQINSQDYYVEMAIAWLLAEAMVNFQKEIIGFLKDDTLSRFTHNKAIQKARESYRISDDDKKLLLSLKRWELGAGS